MPLSVPTAVALTLLYAVASRVEFESGVASTVPTQLVFVPMLFLLPTPAVPLFVAAGLLLGRLPRYLTGYTPVNRAVVELGDALYSIGPVLVLVLAGAETPAFGDWPVYVLALAAQFAGDISFSSLRLWLGLGTPPQLGAARARLDLRRRHAALVRRAARQLRRRAHHVRVPAGAAAARRC